MFWGFRASSGVHRSRRKLLPPAERGGERSLPAVPSARVDFRDEVDQLTALAHRPEWDVTARRLGFPSAGIVPRDCRRPGLARSVYCPSMADGWRRFSSRGCNPQYKGGRGRDSRGECRDGHRFAGLFTSGDFQVERQQLGQEVFLGRESVGGQNRGVKGRMERFSRGFSRAVREVDKPPATRPLILRQGIGTGPPHFASGFGHGIDLRQRWRLGPGKSIKDGFRGVAEIVRSASKHLVTYHRQWVSGLEKPKTDSHQQMQKQLRYIARARLLFEMKAKIGRFETRGHTDVALQATLTASSMSGSYSTESFHHRHPRGCRSMRVVCFPSLFSAFFALATLIIYTGNTS